MRLTAVVVRGRSMRPTLADGDCLLVRRGGRVRTGELVVGRLLDRPGPLVVKRATAPAGDGTWLLESDDREAPGAVSGLGVVHGVVLARYWPWPPRRLS